VVPAAVVTVPVVRAALAVPVVPAALAVAAGARVGVLTLALSYDLTPWGAQLRRRWADIGRNGPAGTSPNPPEPAQTAPLRRRRHDRPTTALRAARRSRPGTIAGRGPRVAISAG
jgi:hypothetical protein